jgi:Flp pilus assembly protein TadD
MRLLPTSVLVLAIVIAPVARAQAGIVPAPAGRGQVTLLLAPATRAQAELAQGQQLFAEGRFEEAEPLLDAATRADPRNAGAWNQLGLARHAIKRFEAALPAFERALALVPGDPLVLDNIGVCRFELQDFTKAGFAFRSALEKNPEDSRARLFLGRIALALGDDAGAEREFAAAVAVAKPDPLACFHQGLFYFQGRRLDDAERSFARAVELDPLFAGAHLNLGLVLQRKGDKAGAQKHLARFRELSEISSADERMRQRVTSLLKLANTDLEAGRLDAALASVLLAKKEGPELPVVHQFLGHVYSLQGRHEDSARELELFEVLSRKAEGK